MAYDTSKLRTAPFPGAKALLSSISRVADTPRKPAPRTKAPMPPREPPPKAVQTMSSKTLPQPGISSTPMALKGPAPSGQMPNIPPGGISSTMMAKMKKGGKVSSASKRADGIAQRGKTRGKVI